MTTLIGYLRDEASRTWGSIVANAWSQLVAEAVVEKNLKSGPGAQSRFRPQPT